MILNETCIIADKQMLKKKRQTAVVIPQEGILSVTPPDVMVFLRVMFGGRLLVPDS